MSGLTYETVARFAQQAGTVFFGLMFLGGLIYALWPRHSWRGWKRYAACWRRHCFGRAWLAWNAPRSRIGHTIPLRGMARITCR